MDLETGHKGTFSTKTLSLGLGIDLVSSNHPFHEAIWEDFYPEKVKFFLWEVSHNAINTCNSVHRRFPHMALSPHRCIICKSNFDSLSHLFINCHFVNRFWKEISSLFGWITAFPNDINNLLSYTLTNHPLRRSCGCI